MTEWGLPLAPSLLRLPAVVNRSGHRAFFREQALPGSRLWHHSLFDGL